MTADGGDRRHRYVTWNADRYRYVCMSHQGPVQVRYPWGRVVHWGAREATSGLYYPICGSRPTWYRGLELAGAAVTCPRCRERARADG
ncbi:MAG: hypothetical protein LC792_22425 [Actinobacteria bacterium]|nr:hypothetical protein [Actinomycetota bacterium]